MLGSSGQVYLHCHRQFASLNQDNHLGLHDKSGSGSCRAHLDDGALLLLLGCRGGAVVVLLVHGGGGTGSGRPSVGVVLEVLRRCR